MGLMGAAAIGSAAERMTRRLWPVPVRTTSQTVPALNHRQLALLGYALRHPKEGFTFRTHAESHGLTHETARTDLRPLAEKGLAHRTVARGRHVFFADPGLSRLLESVS